MLPEFFLTGLHIYFILFDHDIKLTLCMHALIYPLIYTFIYWVKSEFLPYEQYHEFRPFKCKLN